MTRFKDGKGDEILAADLAGRNLVEPPLATLRKAFALKSQLPVPLATLGQSIALLFDSWIPSAATGWRRTSPAEATERRLLYRVDSPQHGLSCDVDLWLRCLADGTWQLTGQLLPPPTGARLEVRIGRKVQAVGLGECGDFIVAAPRARDVEIRVELADGTRLELPAIDLEG